jgi:uncharacterized protein
MAPQESGQAELANDTVINVAALLRELTGATRAYRFTLNRFRLDDDLDAVDVRGTVRLTRLTDAILVAVAAEARVVLECQRCLTEFAQSVEIAFEEPFRAAYDVRSGAPIESDLEGLDERLEIGENHELDFSEPMRQEIIVALPMRPVCGDDCPGPPHFGDVDEEDDKVGFAVLASLLEPDDETK